MLCEQLIAFCTQLRFLNLDGNKLQSYHLHLILRSLTTGKCSGTIERVSLLGNQPTYKISKTLAQFIEATDNLTSLMISHFNGYQYGIRVTFTEAKSRVLGLGTKRGKIIISDPLSQQEIVKMKTKRVTFPIINKV